MEYKCLPQALEPLDQVDGHTLSSVSLASVGCPDPALLSNIFQEAPCHSSPDTLLVPLQDAIDITTSYSVYSSGPQFSISSSHYDPELATVQVTVPELAYHLQGEEDGVTLTIPDPDTSSTSPDYRLGVLARTWTPDLTTYLSGGLWTDIDIVCRGGTSVPCHRLLLAAASPLLSSCLSSIDCCPEEKTCVLLPDFTAEEVRQFLDILYLKNLRSDCLPATSLLVDFLSSLPPTSTFQPTTFEATTSEAADKQENIKNEEKFKKMPVEVKMEASHEHGDKGTKILGKKLIVTQNNPENQKIKGPHTCEKCGKTFKLSRILKEHMGLHGAPRFACEVVGCKRKFHLKANLKAHVEVVHLKTKNISCEVCGKKFYNQTHLRAHMEHHNTDKHVCEHCSNYFSCSKSLRDHIKFKHSNPENSPKCEICNKVYSTPQNLKSHVARVHMQEKKFICSECGRSFFEKAELDFHLSSHNPKDQNIQCDICKLMFKNSKTLYYHKKRSHDPTNKIHICYQCGKSYTDSHHLNRHMESHGQKTSFCKTCGKAFQSEQKVKAHVRKVHEKWRRSDEAEKPCALCDKKFPNFGSMKRHLKDVHKMSVAEANTILIERFGLDPKKHRINPSEVFSSPTDSGNHT